MSGISLYHFGDSNPHHLTLLNIPDLEVKVDKAIIICEGLDHVMVQGRAEESELSSC